MKRKLIVAVAILGVWFTFSNAEPEIIDKSNNSSNILIESSYQGGLQYEGIVICGDGSIYSFDMYDINLSDCRNYPSKRKKIPESLKEKNEYILENAKLENKRVSEKDLAKMIEYISKIDTNKNSERKYTVHNKYIGDVILRGLIIIYDYANNKEIVLKETGGFTLKNTSPRAKDLLKLIEKYTKEVYLERHQKKETERIPK